MRARNRSQQRDGGHGSERQLLGMTEVSVTPASESASTAGGWGQFTMMQASSGIAMSEL